MTTPASASSVLTRSGLASGRSILLIAMTSGTLGRLRVVDRLERLGHDAVVGGHDDHRDVGDLGAAGAHRGERLVARACRGTDGLPSLVVTWYAPMCCVMPPRSPAATVVSRIASSRLVLPWSTWPMMVTIGARATRLLVVVLVVQDLLGGSGAARCRPPRRPRPSASGSRPRSRAPRDEACRVAVDELVDGREDAALDQLADDVPGLTVEQVRELLDGDRARQLDRATLAGSTTCTAPGAKAPARRGGLRGPRRPRVPLLLLAIGPP